VEDFRPQGERPPGQQKKKSNTEFTEGREHRVHGEERRLEGERAQRDNRVKNKGPAGCPGGASRR